MGPVQLAFLGPWNTTLDALVLPGHLDPTQPQKWLLPAGGNNTLHFNVSGAPDVQAWPYFEVQEAGILFSNYPCFL